MARRKIEETVKETIYSMLRAGSYGWMIQEATGVSLSTINKLRKEVMAAGYEHVYHPRGGQVSRYINC